MRERHLSSGSGSELDDGQRKCGNEKPPKPRSNTHGAKGNRLRSVHQLTSRRVSDPESGSVVQRSPMRSRHHSSDSDSASDISFRLKVN